MQLCTFVTPSHFDSQTKSCAHSHWSAMCIFFMLLACTHTRHYPPRLQPQKHENGSPQQPPSPMPDFRSTANGSWANQQQHFAPTHSVNGAHTSIPSGAVPHSAFSTTNGPSVQPMQQQQFVRHSGSYGAGLTAQQAAFDSNTMMRGLTQHNMMATAVGGPWWAPPPPRARTHTHTHTHCHGCHLGPPLLPSHHECDACD